MSLSRHDLSGVSATCVRCLEGKDTSELDGLRWCRSCRRRAQARAARWGWVAGAVVAVPLALWVWLFVDPQLLVGGWVGITLATFWLAARMVRRIVYAGMRFRNRPGVGALVSQAPSWKPPGPGDPS